MRRTNPQINRCSKFWPSSTSTGDNLLRRRRGAHERFVLVVSDGINHQEAMLSTKQNQFVHDGTLKVNCCIRLNSYILDVVRVKKIIIIFDLAVEHPDITQRIGNPVWIENLNLDLRFSGTTLTCWVSEGEQSSAGPYPAGRSSPGR